MPATAPYKIIDERTDTPPPHPGEILREDVLPYFKVTASELARHLDVPLAALSGILSERAPVDRSIAVLLGGSLVKEPNIGWRCNCSMTSGRIA